MSWVYSTQERAPTKARLSGETRCRHNQSIGDCSFDLSSHGLRCPRSGIARTRFQSSEKLIWAAVAGCSSVNHGLDSKSNTGLGSPAIESAPKKITLLTLLESSMPP